MSDRSRARKLQRTLGLSYQQALARVRSGPQPAPATVQPWPAESRGTPRNPLERACAELLEETSALTVELVHASGRVLASCPTFLAWHAPGSKLAASSTSSLAGSPEWLERIGLRRLSVSVTRAVTLVAVVGGDAMQDAWVRYLLERSVERLAGLLREAETPLGPIPSGGGTPPTSAPAQLFLDARAAIPRRSN